MTLNYHLLYHQPLLVNLLKYIFWATTILSISVPVSAITCPPDHLISPCKCISRYSLISCDNLPANANIASIFRSLSDSLLRTSSPSPSTTSSGSESQPLITFDQFKLVNSELTELGNGGKVQDLFAGVAFKKINILRNKKLKRIDENAFTASANATTELVFEDNAVLGSEETDVHTLFRLANSFPNLQVLHITECDIRLVPDHAFSRAQPALREIMMTDNRIRSIGAKPFTLLSGLELLNLDGNQISHFSVDSFNMPLNRLHPKKRLKIFLNSNALNDGSLPVGIFARLRRPAYLNLDRNNLTTLPEAVFGSLALRGSVLSLRKNPLRCDCRLKWLVDQKLLYSSSSSKNKENDEDAYFLLRHYVCRSDKDEDTEIHEAEETDFEHCQINPLVSKVHCGADDMDPEEEHTCLTSSLSRLRPAFVNILFSHFFLFSFFWVLF